MSIRKALVLTCVLSLVATLSVCDAPAGDARDSAAEVRDSAGVRVVHNTSRAADTLAFELVEELRIGVADGPPEYQFYRIGGVAADSAGRIYVADQSDRTVRVFDRNGVFVRGFGRRGEGPGEFTRAHNLLLWRDTVHVANQSGRGSLSALFDTAGTLLATFNALVPNGSSITPVGRTPTGWIVIDDSLFARKHRAQPGEVTQYAGRVAHVDADALVHATRSREAADTLLRTIIHFTGGRIFWELGSEGGSERFPLGNPPYFEPAVRHAVDGRGLLHVTAGWPYVISTYNATGALVRRVTRAHDSIPVDDAMMRELMRRVGVYYDTLRDVRGASMQSYEKRVKYQRIGFVPVTSAVLASPDGWLWVRRPDLDPDPISLEFSAGLPPRPLYWDVFDGDGVLRHTVRTPPGFAVRAVAAGSVVGVQLDEMDVPYVVRYALRAR